MAWMIDGNKLKEKAVPLLIPSEMELSGFLPNPVQAVMVSEIEGMLYRDGIEVVRCGECRLCGKRECPMSGTPGIVSSSDFCSYGERRAEDDEND